MRLGHKAEIITDGSTLIGINLGSDYVAEHEWGIKELRSDFGISEKYVLGKVGFETTKIQQISKRFGLFTGKNNSIGAGYGRYEHTDKNDVTNFFYKEDKQFGFYSGILKEMENGLFYRKDNLEISGAWDSSTFAFLMTKSHKQHYDELINAFETKNIAMSLGKSKIFENGGLNFLIYDKIPKETFQHAIDQHLSTNRLNVKVAKIGLAEKLTKRGLKWYALSPKWVNNDEKDIVYWLNPYNQESVNYGWFTEEQLLQWIDGIGPIPKKTSQLEKL
jgi:hypothetical protein